MVLKYSIFHQNAENFYISRFKFASMWSIYVSNELWRDFRLQVSVFATVARKSFNSKCPAKMIFRSGINVTITDTDIRSLSVHYIILRTTCCWNLTIIAWCWINKMLNLYWQKKNDNHYWECVEVILEDVSVTLRTFQCHGIR